MFFVILAEDAGLVDQVGWVVWVGFNIVARYDSSGNFSKFIIGNVLRLKTGLDSFHHAWREDLFSEKALFVRYGIGAEVLEEFSFSLRCSDKAFLSSGSFSRSSGTNRILFCLFTGMGVAKISRLIRVRGVKCTILVRAGCHGCHDDSVRCGSHCSVVGFAILFTGVTRCGF